MGGKDDKLLLFPTSSLIIAETEKANSNHFIFLKPYSFGILPVPVELRRLFQHVIEVSNGSTCNMYLFFLLFPICNWYFVVYLNLPVVFMIDILDMYHLRNGHDLKKNLSETILYYFYLTKPSNFILCLHKLFYFVTFY